MRTSTSTAYIYSKAFEHKGVKFKEHDTQLVCLVGKDSEQTIDSDDLFRIVGAHNALVAACAAALRALQPEQADDDSIFDVAKLERLLAAALALAGECPRCHGSSYVIEGTS